MRPHRATQPPSASPHCGASSAKILASTCLRGTGCALTQFESRNRGHPQAVLNHAWKRWLYPKAMEGILSHEACWHHFMPDPTMAMLSLDRLNRLEDEHGFSEKMLEVASFFRRGENDA